MSLIWRERDTHGNVLRRGDLYPPFLASVEAAFAQLPDTWYVTYGYRSIALQAQLYEAYRNGGPRAAPPGKSAHNYGCALDVVLDADPNTPGLQPSWNQKLAGWVRYYALFLQHTLIRDGRAFQDGGHVEWRNWKFVKQQANLKTL